MTCGSGGRVRMALQQRVLLNHMTFVFDGEVRIDQKSQGSFFYQLPYSPSLTIMFADRVPLTCIVFTCIVSSIVGSPTNATNSSKSGWPMCCENLLAGRLCNAVGKWELELLREELFDVWTFDIIGLLDFHDLKDLD